MAVGALLRKELREHGSALLVLSAGFMLVSLLQAINLQAGAFSMSPLDLVRIALVTLLPLSAFVLGNRLVVREYLGGTRLFVEALPVSRATPLVLKYVFGLVYLVSLCMALLVVAAVTARVVDGIDSRFFSLLATKSLAVIWLLWSLVFSISLCGRLRLVLYALVIIVVLALQALPGIDESVFGPFALLDAETFAYERTVFPWSALMMTTGLAMLISAFGFLLATINEGSLTERLAKPMSRQDMVALGVLGFGGFTLVSTLMKEQAIIPFAFIGDTVLRNDSPALAIDYLEPAHKEQAQHLFDALSQALNELSIELEITSMPVVRVGLREDLTINELDISSEGGVLIRGNYPEFDNFETDVLLAGLVHQVLADVSQSRGLFEPYHWILDGFSHWWIARQRDDSNLERRAMAVWGIERLPEEHTLAEHWQITTNRLNYWVTESLAYSALEYLESETSAAVVMQLARETLVGDVSNTSLQTIRAMQAPAKAQFERITGIDWSTFNAGWRKWLMAQRSRTDLQAWLNATPVVVGRLAGRNQDGVAEIVGEYERLPGSVRNPADDTCVFRHAYMGAYDHEIYIEHDKTRELHVACQTDVEAHVSSRYYSSGHRVLAVLEVESMQFHHPFRVASMVLTLP